MRAWLERYLWRLLRPRIETTITGRQRELVSVLVAQGRLPPINQLPVDTPRN